MCYTVPAAAAILTTFIQSRNKRTPLFWLMLMFYGSALFGIIDHLWNGELFLISENWAKDLGLGVLITIVTILAWRVILSLAKKNPELNSQLLIGK